MRTILTALFLTLALATTAAAQDRPASLAPDVQFEFGDHAVDGGRHQPDQASLFLRTGIMRESLVRPRVHFVPELLKSVEGI